MGEGLDRQAAAQVLDQVLDQVDELEAYQGAIDKLLTGEPQVPLTPREWQALWAPARKLAVEIRRQLDPPARHRPVAETHPQGLAM